MTQVSGKVSVAVSVFNFLHYPFANDSAVGGRFEEKEVSDS